MASATVFVVSGDPAVRDSLAELLGSAGLRATTFDSLEQWRGAVPPEQPGCLILDARVSEVTGPEHPEGLARICAMRPVLMLIDRGDVPIAVRAIREGAVDVLEKPYREQILLARVGMALHGDRRPAG
jgi:two-component system response regulator FixJ